VAAAAAGGCGGGGGEDALADVVDSVESCGMRRELVVEK
jgi:hypothetical protein